MTHPRRKIARTESTRITDNLDTIEAIHQRFCQALGPSALPNINSEVTDGTESITLTAETDFYMHNPRTNTDVGHVFLSYLAAYAPDFVATFVTHNPGQLAAATQWEVDNDGALLIERPLEQEPTYYSTAAVRRNHPEINDTDLRDLRPDSDPDADPKGYAVYNTLTGSIEPTADGENDNVMSRSRAREHLKTLVTDPGTDLVEENLELIAVGGTGPLPQTSAPERVTIDIADKSNWSETSPITIQSYYHYDNRTTVDYIIEIKTISETESQDFIVTVKEAASTSLNHSLTERRNNETVLFEVQRSTEAEAKRIATAAVEHIEARDTFDKETFQ
jgi:hypothetical protein